MPNYKVVDADVLDADLQTVADAIKAKAGTEEALEFPSGFASAVESIETGGDGGNTGDDEGWIGDGNTHVWISLQKGRTSPMLGVCPKGTVTVDWGDGTTPDVLTGTSLTAVVWTPTHEYAEPGDYVIKLTVDGSMCLRGTNTSCILRCVSSNDNRNIAYLNAVRKVEAGVGVNIDQLAFADCSSLESATIQNSTATNFNGVFMNCYSLASVTLSDSMTSVRDNAFKNCYNLKSAVIPNSVTSMGDEDFYGCYNLKSAVIPNSVTSMGIKTFNQCYTLDSIVLPRSVTTINQNFAYNCNALVEVTVLGDVTSIASSAFSNCYCVRHYDFTACTSVPTLASTNAFTKIAADCEIRVPAALYDEWITATNWATYASQIVAV